MAKRFDPNEVVKDPLKHQELVRVGTKKRQEIRLAVGFNRYSRHRYDMERQAKQGPGCCTHCGREPCAQGWGPRFDAKTSVRCCDRCDHAPLEGFVPTHVVWTDHKAFFVMEMLLPKSDAAVYLRADGVAWFFRSGMRHWFLGRELPPARVARYRIDDPAGWPLGMEQQLARLIKDIGVEEASLDLEEPSEFEAEDDEDDAEDEDEESDEDEDSDDLEASADDDDDDDDDTEEDDDDEESEADDAGDEDEDDTDDTDDDDADADADDDAADDAS